MNPAIQTVFFRLQSLPDALRRSRAFHLFLIIAVLILLVVALPFALGWSNGGGDMSAYTTTIRYEADWFPYYNSVGE
ncbi:MAG: hypothetical protein AB7F35_00790 [Acetobacteraceae bacterium]